VSSSFCIIILYLRTTTCPFFTLGGTFAFLTLGTPAYIETNTHDRMTFVLKRKFVSLNELIFSHTVTIGARNRQIDHTKLK